MRCPDDEKFAQYAEGKLCGDEQLKFLLHLSECSQCSILYAMTCMNMNESVCPDEESISCLAEGKLSRHKREALLMHTAQCKTCSAELYLLRKRKSSKANVRRSTLRKAKFQLIALAAMIALIIGFTGVNVIEDDKFTGGGKNLSVAQRDVEIHDSISAKASAPLIEIAQDSAAEAKKQHGMAMDKRARITTSATTHEMAKDVAFQAQEEPKTQETLKMEQFFSDEISTEGTEPVYVVIYSVYKGEKSEIVRLIQMFTGKDEKSAEKIAEGSSVVVKECSSIEEAQNIKQELEAAGAKVNIQRR